jgi:uncharacterized protein with PIN domain
MKFFLEGSLKGLSKWLRFMGYQTEICENRITKEEVFLHKDKIFLITSPETAEMLEKAGVKYVLLPREGIENQLFFIFHKLGLKPELKLDICTVCGARLIPIQKEKVKDKVPPRVFELYENFNFCPGCQRIYWEGDHIKRLKKKFVCIVSRIMCMNF